ncbi:MULTISPECIES: phage tail protein [unclassified Pseudomonas]|uniref:phage tail protein n=1 Tax=unclassified Pseudomonas TaxID=196821 RepID=UPI0025809A94|nr:MULTISPECIES: tail fiber protein [unclassified Pseudomonas]
MDAFFGEIRLFPFNYVPQGWQLCDGTSLLVQTFPGLYAVIGNKYGGNSVNFNVPNLLGEVTMGVGSGPGLTPRKLNDVAGANSVQLQPDNFAPHTHELRAQPGNSFSEGKDVPSNATFLSQPRTTLLYSANAGNPEYTLADASVGVTGSSGLIQRSTQQPYLTFAYCICVDGIFPQKP